MRTAHHAARAGRDWINAVILFGSRRTAADVANVLLIYPDLILSPALAGTDSLGACDGGLTRSLVRIPHPRLLMKLLNRLLLILVVLLPSAGYARSPAAHGPSFDLPNAAQILPKLRPGHPRLIASTERFEQLKRDIESDQTLARWYTNRSAKGEASFALVRRSTRSPTACDCWRPAAECWIASRRWRCCTDWTATAARSNGRGASWRRRRSFRTGTRGISWTRPK